MQSVVKKYIFGLPQMLHSYLNIGDSLPPNNIVQYHLVLTSYTNWIAKSNEVHLCVGVSFHQENQLFQKNISHAINNLIIASCLLSLFSVKIP